MEQEVDGAARPRGRHINKRALKNKAVAVSFNEKDLRDYVGGFHKRKKKRRKEAQVNLQEAERRKRIELRKKRKLEREFVQYGGAPPGNDSRADECAEDDEADPIASVSGMATYDTGDLKIIVTTSEICCEEDKYPIEKIQATVARSTGEADLGVVSKKPFKRVMKHRSRPKLQPKRERKKEKKKSNKRSH